MKTATEARSTCEDNIKIDLKYCVWVKLVSFGLGCSLVMGCCEDCDEPSESLQDAVIFSDLNKYLVSALGQSWNGSLPHSVTDAYS